MFQPLIFQGVPFFFRKDWDDEGSTWGQSWPELAPIATSGYHHHKKMVIQWYSWKRVWYTFSLHEWLIFLMVHVGKYTIHPMDPMGVIHRASRYCHQDVVVWRLFNNFKLQSDPPNESSWKIAVRDTSRYRSWRIDPSICHLSFARTCGARVWGWAILMVIAMLRWWWWSSLLLWWW